MLYVCRDAGYIALVSSSKRHGLEVWYTVLGKPEEADASAIVKGAASIRYMGNYQFPPTIIQARKLKRKKIQNEM